MSSVLSIAVSGLLAAEHRLQVSARNIANASVAATSADTKPDARMATAQTVPANRATARSGGATGAVLSDTPGTDPGADIVQLLMARYSFAASAKVVVIETTAQKSLINITA